MIASLEKKTERTFARGIHPPESKELACRAVIEVLPTPEQVIVPLLQHTGAPNAALVSSKQNVALGDKIGAVDAFISAPVHASLAGTVGRETVATLPNGRHVQALPIKAEGAQLEAKALWDDIFGGSWSAGDVKTMDPKSISDAVREAGIVGQGGAAFPTSVKLMRNDKRPVDTLLVNGCECEPYLTADHRLMLEAPAAIVEGVRLAAWGCGAENIVIAVEDNKMDAVQALRSAAETSRVDIVAVKTKYPMGGEKQTVLSVLGRTIPTGGLPLDVGVVVINVATAAAVARALLRKKPLTHRVISVTGEGIVQPKNLLAPIGVSYGELINFCGGLKPDTARVIAGGPMMGFTLSDFSTPITKGTSGIVALTHEALIRLDETPCVRCGRCVDVCPLNLVPSRIALAARHKDWDLAKRYHMRACMECGCCGYTCPAGIPLVQLIRMGKAQAPKEN